MRVAFLGGAGAFSEEAAHALIPARPPGFSPVPGLEPDWDPVLCSSVPAVAEAVKEGAAHVGVLPLENSIAGPVEGSLEIWWSSGLQAWTQVALPVRQCVFALPGVALDSIQEVWSHPQALAQCAPYVKARGWKTVPTGSTVAGADHILATQTRTTAVLGSPRLGEAKGLASLATDVQSAKENFTRFVALALAVRQPPTGKDQTTLAVVPRRGAAGLREILAVLEKGGAPLLRLHLSRQPEPAWRQIFVLDVEGHRFEARTQALLQKVEALSEWYRWMGSYPRELRSEELE